VSKGTTSPASGSGGTPAACTTSPCPKAKVGKATMTEAEAQQFMDDFKKTDIPFDYPPDCCYSRARKMCDIMEKKGFSSQKLWSEGRLRATRADGSPVTFPNEQGVATPVTWHYHVAPIVNVQTPDGKTSPRILDPSLSDKPLTVDEWKKLCGGTPTVDKTTPPEENYPFHPATAGKEYTVAEAEATMQEHRDKRDRNRAAAGSPP